MTAGRNDACPCGSGKKYKRCCLDKDAAQSRAANLATARESAAAADVDQQVMAVIRPLLERARTTEEKEKVFAMGAIAIELAKLEDVESQNEALEAYLDGAFEGPDLDSVEEGREAFRSATHALMDQLRVRR